jgi:uncharacterized protein (DUF2147 family)
MNRVFFAFFAFALLAAPVTAATITGVWATEPDAKAQIGHVQITPCGASLCGTIISAYDKAGKQITTPNVGRQIIKDARAQGANTFGGGTVYVPVMKAEFPVEITVAGNKLTLRACNKLGVCRRQIWTRVK